MSASLAFQKFARAHLAADAALLALVPAANIGDGHAVPERFPSIILGEDQELPADDVVGRYSQVFPTLHIWTDQPGLASAKAIAGAVRSSLNLRTFILDGFRCIDCRFQSARFIRDPDPDREIGHGIVTFVATIEEL
jgi:hypothetical protein